jgi:hypothetical protein
MKNGPFQDRIFGRSRINILLLGYLDSNQEQRYQKPPCCQLHHTPEQVFGAAMDGTDSLLYRQLDGQSKLL